MDFIIAIVMGGIIGWLASLVMNRDASMGIFWNIIVGHAASCRLRWIKCFGRRNPAIRRASKSSVERCCYMESRAFMPSCTW